MAPPLLSAFNTILEIDQEALSCCFARNTLPTLCPCISTYLGNLTTFVHDAYFKNKIGRTQSIIAAKFATREKFSQQTETLVSRHTACNIQKLERITISNPIKTAAASAAREPREFQLEFLQRASVEEEPRRSVFEGTGECFDRFGSVRLRYGEPIRKGEQKRPESLPPSQLGKTVAAGSAATFLSFWAVLAPGVETGTARTTRRKTAIYFEDFQRRLASWQSIRQRASAETEGPPLKLSDGQGFRGSAQSA
ncbi:hypothetical protein K0M31_013800 [Melipona bicolor]|uniref:Uncharacterized protein n=1 Tax=Melipona bicolor TaxID=60889 RepID=A0AA40FHL5_9HYME|nr:hypothetical protein K0M31_013800 [Melipona bicolor]